MSDQLDERITEVLAGARDDAPRAHSWNDVLVRSESAGRPAGRRRRWVRPVTAAASLVLVVALGVGIVARIGDDSSQVATSQLPARLDVVSVDGAGVDLRPLAEYTSFEDGDVLIPTTMFDDFEIRPLLLRESNTEARAVSTADDSIGVTLQSFRSMGDPADLASQPDVESAVDVDIEGVSWNIRTYDDGFHSAATRLGATDEGRANGASVTVSGIAVADLETFLAGLRVGSAAEYPQVSYDVDAGAERVYESAADDLRLEFARIGGWNCWSLFDGATAEARAGGCADTTPQPDGAVLLGSSVWWPDEADADPTQPIPATGSTAVTVGIVPAWAIAVDVEYPGGRVDRVDVADLTGRFDAQFFVTSARVDSADVTQDELITGEPLTTIRAVYDSEVSVVEVDVEPADLRPLSGLDDASVVVPTAMVEGAEIQPLIIRSGGRADMLAQPVDDRRLSVIVSTSQRLPARTDPVDRVVESNGVRWDVRIFQDLSFAQADIGNQTVAVDTIGVTDDALDLVLAGLRVGSPSDVPAGTYDVDEGADTVFRSAEDGRSLEYLEMGRWRCWTARDGNGVVVSGGCADPEQQPGGAVVLSRFAVPSEAPDGQAIESTAVYTVGVLPPDAVSVDLEYDVGRIEQGRVDDLTDSFDAQFFFTRADFDGDVDIPDTIVRAIIDPQG